MPADEFGLDGAPQGNHGGVGNRAQRRSGADTVGYAAQDLHADPEFMFIGPAPGPFQHVLDIAGLTQRPVQVRA